MKRSGSPSQLRSPPNLLRRDSWKRTDAEWNLDRCFKKHLDDRNRQAVDSQVQYLLARASVGKKTDHIIQTWCNGKTSDHLVWPEPREGQKHREEDMGVERGNGEGGGGWSPFYLYATKHISPPHYQAAICKAPPASLLRTGLQHRAWYPQLSPSLACGGGGKKSKHFNDDIIVSTWKEKKTQPPARPPPPHTS